MRLSLMLSIARRMANHLTPIAFILLILGRRRRRNRAKVVMTIIMMIRTDATKIDNGVVVVVYTRKTPMTMIIIHIRKVRKVAVNVRPALPIMWCVFLHFVSVTSLGVVSFALIDHC
jgi:hypothetical protein